MAGPQPKQFLTLDGLPILIHSLRAFAAVERVTAIYVAVRQPEIERVQAQIAEYASHSASPIASASSKAATIARNRSRTPWPRCPPSRTIWFWSTTQSAR